MDTFAVPHATLATELSDEGGHPVVQLHGLTSSRRRDRTLGLDLGRGLSGTRLLRYDARGHGESTGRPVAADYQWPHLATDLLTLLDAAFPGEKVHGVGQSMGAATLLHAAVREPERFNALTLMLPPTAWQTRAERAHVYLSHAALVEESGMEAFLAADSPAAVPPAMAGRPETLPDVRADVLPSLFRGAAASDLPSAGEIAQISVPTMILAWEGDPAHPLSTALTLREVMPEATLTVAKTPAQVSAWPALLYLDVSRAH